MPEPDQRLFQTKPFRPFLDLSSLRADLRRIILTGLVVVLLLSGCSLQALPVVQVNQQVSEATCPTTIVGADAKQPTPAETLVPEHEIPAITPTSVYEGSPSVEHPAIALTFDDGPSLRDTGTLLDLLANEDVRVTFFVLGSQLASGKTRRALTARAAEEGHEIANHGYSHLLLKQASETQIREELSKTSVLIEQTTGSKPTLMRAPMNGFNDTTKAVCQDLEMAIVSWSWQNCPEDWNHRGDPQYIADFVVEHAENGQIILLHDTNNTTIEAMPAMIAGLKARGFRFMTVSELLSYGGENEPEPGQVYTQLKSPKSFN